MINEFNSIDINHWSLIIIQVHLSYFLKEFRGVNKVSNRLVIRFEDSILATFPFLVPILEEDNLFPYLHDRVHIVGIDNGGDVKLFCYGMN